MTGEEYRAAIDDVIYLAACAINGNIPDAEKIQKMDLSCVFQAASVHQLISVAGAALQSAGIRDERFYKETAQAQRRTALMDSDREALLACMERKGIWYMPLKGCVLKDLYPRYGMREMADNDILIDPERTSDVKSIMESLGFITKKFGGDMHDIYHKKPVSNFEIHTTLYPPFSNPVLYRYYQNVKPRLLKDEENRYGYHFSDEDFYIYLISHEFKHYSGGGTGLRSFLDEYVYIQKYGDSLDWNYIDAEMRKIGLTEFEKQSRSLSVRLFSNAALNAKEKEMLEYVIWSGTYGTTEHRVDNKVKDFGGGTRGKARYIMHRLFLPMREVKESYPVFYRHKILLPLLVFWRIGKGLVIHRKNLIREMKALFHL